MKLTQEALAAILSGREYGNEITKVEEVQAMLSDLVVVYGYSDDIMELRGAVRDEVGSCDGGTYSVTARGVLAGWPRGEEKDEADARAFFEAEKLPRVKVTANWCPKDEPGYSWTFSVDVPFATFEVLEDGAPFCRGIVFSAEHLKGGAK